MATVRATPMTVDEARCLAMAYELNRLLGELFERPDNGPDSPVETAWDLSEEIIDVLDGSAPFRSAAGKDPRAAMVLGQISQRMYRRRIG